MVLRKCSSGVACLVALALAACSSDRAPDPRTKAPQVRTEAVQSAATATRSFTGVIAARVESDLGFRVPGKVLERLVDTGQAVRRGQVLMRMDPIDLGLQARAQQEAVAAAQARARQTAADETRYRDLVAEGAVSASAYDQVKAAAESARAQLKAAEAQADVARNASSYVLLLADADGVVVETLAEPGQVVSAGQPVIRLARAGQREAMVHLPETLRPDVGSAAKATLYGQRSKPVSAKLRQLSNAADTVTRTYEARYVLEGALAQAPLGATVTIEIPDGTASMPSLQVPIGALFDSGKGPGVWIVRGRSAKVTWRAVQLLSIADDVAQVRGDIEPGDQVVSLGAHLIREGQIVRRADEGNVPPAGDRP